MPISLDELTELAPLATIAAAAALAITLVIVIDRVLRRLGDHDRALSLLEVRLDNLHREKRRRYAQSLQAAPPLRATVSPPPLSLARTIDVSDADLLTRDTVPYPDSEPPEPP